MSQPKLGVIIGSVRPVRVGEVIGRWIAAQAEAHGGFEVDLIDLKEVALPFADEPGHPIMQQYQHEHTQAWSARVKSNNAFVLVTPEYNHGYPAALKNALDTVMKEWWYKPVGFASYGGVSAGLRSVSQLKPVTSALRMFETGDSFMAPFVATQISDGVFTPTETQLTGVKNMLDELVKLTAALRPLQLG